MINLTFALFSLVLMTVVSLITALVIEAIKKIVSEESIKNAFKSLEIFSLVFTLIVAFFVYLIFSLLTITVAPTPFDIFELIIAGILFILSCGCGSQVGYDKVIKTIKNIIAMLGGSNAIQ